MPTNRLRNKYLFTTKNIFKNTGFTHKSTYSYRFILNGITTLYALATLIPYLVSL